jgi:hypothetical protein
MKMIKMALLGGAAMAVTAASAKADDLEALKAQIDSLNTRIAAMEAAPSVPTGYQLIAISEGELQQTPGLSMSNRELAAYGNKATVISVLPTADAPAGTTITWSGYARAGLVYQNVSTDASVDGYDWDQQNEEWTFNENASASGSNDDDDIDVKARGQIRVKASTDTAVGEVGVDIRMRANFNGNGSGDVYSDVAWGYWAMTPELTFGGGYAGSLGNIGYGYDGACTCYYTDNADLGFNPNDTTQMRLSYGSGPVSFAVALEDASLRAGGDNFNADDRANVDQLGAAGEMKYSGDIFSGEISGVWRGVNGDELSSVTLTRADDSKADFDILDSELDAMWQVGVGLGFALGDMANLSLAAAMGEGPLTESTDGNVTAAVPYNQSWWGVSALASFNLSDEFHAEVAAGYKKREGDDVTLENANDKIYEEYQLQNVEYDTYGVLGGIYYSPVDQLTIGVEAEWFTTSTSYSVYGDEDSEDKVWDTVEDVEVDQDTFSIDLVSVWRF